MSATPSAPSVSPKISWLILSSIAHRAYGRHSIPQSSVSPGKVHHPMMGSALCTDIELKITIHACGSARGKFSGHYEHQMLVGRNTARGAGGPPGGHRGGLSLAARSGYCKVPLCLAWQPWTASLGAAKIPLYLTVVDRSTGSKDSPFWAWNRASLSTIRRL